MKINFKKFFKIFFIILFIFIATLILEILFFNKIFHRNFLSFYNPPKSFKECLAGQNIIREIYPRQCVDKRGQIFIEDLGNELEKRDLIQLDYPRSNNQIKSPLIINGRARGYWFFEASFPVSLVDENNNVLANGIAVAEGDWMTENFVAFKAQLNFSVSTPTAAFLILKKDNPSGLTENDDYLKISIELIK